MGSSYSLGEDGRDELMIVAIQDGPSSGSRLFRQTLPTLTTTAPAAPYPAFLCPGRLLSSAPQQLPSWLGWELGGLGDSLTTNFQLSTSVACSTQLPSEN